MKASSMRILVAAVAAVAAFTLARSALAAPRVAGCVNVQDFGADPADSATDDALPIRNAIVAALASSGPHAVCLPGGVYNLLTTVTVSGAQVAFDLSAAADLSIAGEGPATVLKLGNIAQTSVQVFYLASGSARIRFQDLVVDGTAQPGATAATSLFRIGDGATAVSDIALDAVQAVGSGGSGVVIDGSASGSAISQVAIRNSRFAASKGAAIKILQGAGQIAVTTSYFSGNTGLEIDASQAARAINGLTITNNMFAHSAAAGAQPLAIRLSGSVATPSQNATIADNVVLGGRVLVQGFAQVAIAGNSIIGGAQSTSDPELMIGDGVSSVSVTTNVIRRTTCTDGHVIQLGAPANSLRTITLTGNALAQDAAAGCATSASAVQLAPASHVVVSGNHVRFANAAPAVRGVTIGPATTSFSFVALSNNTIEGVSLAAAIEIGGGNGAPPLAIISDNISRGAATGVQVDSTSSTYIPMIANNRFDGATTAIALSASNPAVAIRGNSVGPSQLTGAGNPNARIAAPVGSVYLQTDATSQGLWVKEAGASGNTGWQAKN